MSFIFGRQTTSPAPAPVAPPTPLPPAPVQLARSTELPGDAVTEAVEKRRRRGGAGQRRGLATILTGDQTILGATTGKTLLGA